MVQSLRVRAAQAPCMEAGVLIYCMSTPTVCRVVDKLVRFLDSPESADLLLVCFCQQRSCNCCCSTTSPMRRKRCPPGWLDT